MAYVHVDIDLDDVIDDIDSDDLVDEIIKRHKGNNMKEQDIKRLKMHFLGIDVKKTMGLDELMKREHIEDQISKYTLSELQTLLNR